MSAAGARRVASGRREHAYDGVEPLGIAVRGGVIAWVAADPLRAVLAAIAAVTIASGAAQIPLGGLVLRLLGVAPEPVARQLFGTIGMFMVVVGGLLLHTLAATPVTSSASRVVVLWCGLQKVGAAAAVGIGVSTGAFAPLALAVASFDFLSGILCFIYLRKLAGLSRRSS